VFSSRSIRELLPELLKWYEYFSQYQ
jgi:hypothetical protein